jgi:AraC-like DNA-binding protein
MEHDALPIDGSFFKGFTIYNIGDPDELIRGAHLPLFKRHSKRHVHRPAAKGRQIHPRGQVLSSFGSGKVGELDLSYVVGRHGTLITIIERGLPYYRISTMIAGEMEYQPAGRKAVEKASERIGFIHAGTAGSRFRTTDSNDRLHIWVSAASLEQRLAALLGEPLHEPIAFVPTIDWLSDRGQRIRRLIRVLCEEIAAPPPFLGNDSARRSFEDLFIYSLLVSLKHNYSGRLAQPTRVPAPRTVRRAEAFMRAHVGQSVAIAEIAKAAGCSVRALQVGFRQFRGVTPLAAMRGIRLQAAQEALSRGEVGGSVSDLAKHYGFTHPGRFARLYEAAFGLSPAKALRDMRLNTGASGITQQSRDPETAGAS